MKDIILEVDGMDGVVFVIVELDGGLSHVTETVLS